MRVCLMLGIYLQLIASFSCSNPVHGKTELLYGQKNGEQKQVITGRPGAQILFLKGLISCSIHVICWDNSCFVQNFTRMGMFLSCQTFKLKINFDGE